MSFLHIIFLTYNFDSASATWSSWLKDVQISKVVHLSIILPSLIVIRKYICWRAYLIVLTSFTSLLLNISPEICLASDTPCSSEMIDFLILIHILKFWWPDQCGPQTVPWCRPVACSHEMKTCSLQCINNTVISVSVRTDSKCQLRVWLQILLLY